MVEVLGIDIGDDGDVGRQLEEGAVGFVGLHHHPVAGAEPRVGAVGVDDAAVDHGRIETFRLDQRATIEVVVVLPWVPAIAMQLLSRISSASISARRTTGSRAARAATSSGLSGLIAVETTTHVRAIDVARVVADGDANTFLAQALDVGAVDGVGALHRVAEIGEHLGDAAHADAADADEMDGADIARQLHARSCIPTPPCPAPGSRLLAGPGMNLVPGIHVLLGSHQVKRRGCPRRARA